jgi:hypothetical protein
MILIQNIYRGRRFWCAGMGTARPIEDAVAASPNGDANASAGAYLGLPVEML